MVSRDEVVAQLAQGLSRASLSMAEMRKKGEAGNPRQLHGWNKLLVHLVANALCAKCKQQIDYGNNVTITVADGTIHKVCPTGGNDGR